MGRDCLGSSQLSGHLRQCHNGKYDEYWSTSEARSRTSYNHHFRFALFVTQDPLYILSSQVHCLGKLKSRYLYHCYQYAILDWYCFVSIRKVTIQGDISNHWHDTKTKAQAINRLLKLEPWVNQPSISSLKEECLAAKRILGLIHWQFTGSKDSFMMANHPRIRKYLETGFAACHRILSALLTALVPVDVVGSHDIHAVEAFHPIMWRQGLGLRVVLSVSMR